MEEKPAPAVSAPIRGDRLALRPVRPQEIDVLWHEMVIADPLTIGQLPDEAAFRARLAQSGRMLQGWLDLAIDLDGALIGRIQTFTPPGRPTPPGTYMIGIRLRSELRGKGYGREAIALLTDWLFAHAGAEVVEALTDPANAPMRAVFGHVGWSHAGTAREHNRDWVLYRITRQQWGDRRA